MDTTALQKKMTRTFAEGQFSVAGCATEMSSKQLFDLVSAHWVRFRRE
jgi:hypothetical protein